MKLRPSRAFALSLFVVAACASVEGATTRPSVEDPRDFYPMQAGNAWSYDIDTGESTTTLAVTRIESFDGHIAVVRTAGTVVRYEAVPDGIRVLGGDTWLLRGPLRAGSTWQAPGGREARLLSTQVTAATPAGTFERCIEVLEIGGNLDLEVRTIYCPEVGPVSVSSTMKSKTSERALTVSARLRGYTVNPSSDREP